MKLPLVRKQKRVLNITDRASDNPVSLIIDDIRLRASYNP